MEMNKSLKTLFIILYKIEILLCILSCSLCLYLSISIINQLLKQFYLKNFLVCIVMIITAIYTFYIAYCAHNDCEKFKEKYKWKSQNITILKSIVRTKILHQEKRDIENKFIASVDLDVEEIDNVNLYNFYDKTDVEVSFSKYPKLSDYIKNLQELLEKYGDGYVRNTGDEVTWEIVSMTVTETQVEGCERFRFFNI